MMSPPDTRVTGTCCVKLYMNHSMTCPKVCKTDLVKLLRSAHYHGATEISSCITFTLLRMIGAVRNHRNLYWFVDKLCKVFILLSDFVHLIAEIVVINLYVNYYCCSPFTTGEGWGYVAVHQSFPRWVSTDLCVIPAECVWWDSWSLTAQKLRRNRTRQAVLGSVMLE